MTSHDQRNQDANPSRSEADSVRGGMASFVITAVVTIALVVVLSPKLHELRNEPVVYAEAIAPGPIPSTERRPTQSPIQ